MKILIVNKFFYPKGGSETVMFQERDFLLSSGVEVIDFSMKHPDNKPSAQSDFFVSPCDYDSPLLKTKISMALSFIHSFEAVKKITRLIEKEKPDLVHCHNIYHQLTPSIILAAKRLSVPVVLTLHDYKIICPVYNRLCHGAACNACETGQFSNVLRKRCADGSFGKSALLYLEAIFQRGQKSYEFVDRFIAVSQFMKDAVTKWRVPQCKISLIYNGVTINEDKIPPKNGEEKYILYLGRLSAEKGLITLGKAQENTNIRIIVAGTGPLESVLRNQFPTLELIGQQSGNALKTLLNNAAALVLPSECHENCPMSVLEAMAAGKPVIGSRMGGIPELIEDKKTGLLFTAGNYKELKNAMNNLINHPQESLIMGQHGLTRAKQLFSLENHNNELLKIYENLISKASLS